jgi:1-aminocyclopropane-1-carboxylate deaminase/D-cysteine desulfhydrase-like pyridoxal-dependent ACC family enzyme
MMYGVKELIDDSFFSPDAEILCIHTGGLQGNRSVTDFH